MSNEFLFSFLQPKYKKLADVAEALEKQVYNDVPSALSKARLFAEKLAKYVMEMEDINVYYEMKHVEVIHKLYREGILNEEMHFRFEWIRKMGNKAVHEANFGSVEDALKAHKLTYDLAVWFMELYGDVNFKAPAYASPKAVTEQKVNTDDIKQTVAETVEKTLEAKFREMQETLLKLTQEQQKEKEVVQVVTEQKEQEPVIEEDIPVKEEEKEPVIEEKVPVKEEVQEPAQKEKTLEKVETTDTEVLEEDFDLISYLQSHDIEIIDKRSAGGSLWLIGGWELKEVLDPLKPRKIYFRYTAKGGRVTKRKPAWFLMGSYSDGPKKKESTPKKEVEEPKQVDMPKEIEKEKEKEVVQQVVEKREVTDQQLIVPSRLVELCMNEYEGSPVYTFGEHFHLDTFGEIKEDHLRDWYRKDKQAFYDLAVQLWFLGCEYQGNLAKLINLPHEQERVLIEINTTRNEALSEKLPQHLTELFAKFGVRNIKQLHGLPVFAVRWLTAEAFDEFLNCLKHEESDTDDDSPSSSVEENIQSQHEFEEELQNEDGFIVCMGTECVEIPASMRNIEITLELISGCNTLVKQLRKNMGIHVIGNLPKDILPLREQLRNVGPKMMEKFFSQLGQMGRPKKIEVVVEPIGIQGEEVLLNGERVAIPLSLQEESLEYGDFLSCPSLIEKLHEAGIHQYKQLPLDLQELRKFQGVGDSAVKRFLQHLKEKAEVAEKREQEESFYATMTADERVQYETDQLKEMLQEMIETGSIHTKLKINEKALAIMRERYEGTLNGKRPTLEETAQNHDVTRERIRQIVKNSVGKIKMKAEVWFQLFRNKLEANRNFMENDIFTENTFYEYLVLEMLELEDIYLCFDNQFFTTLTKAELQEFDRQISNIFSERLKGKLLEEEQYEEMIENVAAELEVSPFIVRNTCNEIMRQTEQNQYVLAKAKKIDVAEIVLRQFPNGAEVYKEYEMLNEKANEIMPNSFHGERDFPAICTRDEASDTIYLWGRGIYIHSSFVKPNIELIETIAKEAADKLEKKPVITVTYLFDQYEDVLLENDVPTEYALYTLLRHYGSDHIALPKFPKIIQIGDTGSIRNADLLSDFIRSKGHEVSTKELRDEFIVNRGWKPFTVEFTLSSTQDIIQSNYGEYTLLEFYEQMPVHIFDPIIKRINEKLEEIPQFQINGIFKEFESYCIANGIHTNYLLYYLLRSKCDDHFMLPRYPHIVKIGSELETVSIKTLVEDYILEQGYEVSREEVMDWLVNELGARENAFDIALQLSDRIFYYTRGQYAEYVHEMTIGWNAEKQLELKNVVLDVLAREQQINDKNFIQVEHCLSENLPELDGGLSWTIDLFADCVKRDKEFILLGSRGTIIVPRTSSIQSETDFIQYVLVKEFGGSAKMRDVKKKLMQYGFSADGELLFETETLLADGKAPFVQIGDEIISKHLVEV
ncbi:sigma factor-like helix-turn-helix DNA-binding protein [Bacillus anthracis]|uniref:sigma factor-like helix-turn-helix DNA-binding protein n=1 Tax=Bacillus cereus group TaxID=86661 RepID=UPI0001DA5FF1|nr:sigma factor-like helix-turn-helix DNA-binding protein [Bacillus anthracis]EFI64712.1 type I restriction enzyme EcoKI subunit R [Bacillus cereus SJ1]MEC4696087.1 sigma factor-like helix-turn-helix DNA-binding protein [Bacillus anthracis]